MPVYPQLDMRYANMANSAGYVGNNNSRESVWWCGENTDHRQKVSCLHHIK